MTNNFQLLDQTKRRGRMIGWLVVFLAGLLWATSGMALPTFVLHEYLGKSWSNEVVHFALDQTVTGAATAYRLVGPAGTSVPFQFVTGTNLTRAIAFQLDLPEFTAQTYRLESNNQSSSPATDLRLEQESTVIRIGNSQTGIEIPTAQGAYTNGPLLRLRLQSGQWIGGSRLVSQVAIESYEANVLATGPVYGEVECHYRFAGGKQWQVNYRVMAHEPVVLINESCNLTDGSTWQVLLSPGFSPTHSLTSGTFGEKERAKYNIARLPGNGATAFSLCPWPIWWNPASVAFVGLFRVPQGSTVVSGGGVPLALPRSEELLATPKREELEPLDPTAPKEPVEDFLTLAAGHAEVWANPGDDGQGKNMPLCTGKAGELFLSGSLAGPGRRWLLAALTTKDNLVAATQLTVAQQMMVKHCETPLDEVKDMVLDWESNTTREYPRLVLRRSDLAARPGLQQRNARAETGPPGPLARKLFDPALRIFLGAPNQPAQSVDTIHRCERILNVATCADLLLGADVLTPAEQSQALGIHAVQWGRPVLTAKDVFTAAEIRYARAQIAFLGYKLASPSYYSLERNYRANPNMTTTRYCTMTILAALVPDHPKAKEWAQGGLNEVERELKEWTVPNGGWLESPHYETAAMSAIILMAYAAQHAGFADYLHDARLFGAMRYLARISTPPDPRLDNQRHFPPAGNTYQNETTGLFGIAAKMCRATNPELADEFQWTWIQQGRPQSGLLVNFYNQALFDEFIPATPPKWGSEHFRGSGVVLRNGFPGNRETYMWLLQGVFAEHYDYDRGSFELWGKGRPLCLKWGYNSRMPAWEQNRVDAGNWGDIQKFNTTEAADYLDSMTQGWDRQVILVKGADYFVMRDTIAQPTANWWLWLYTDESLQCTNDVVKVTGIHDVDLDIWLAPKLAAHLKPGKPKAKTNTKAKTPVSMADESNAPTLEDPTTATKPAAQPTGNWIETLTHTVKCFDLRTQKMEPLTQEGLTLPVTKDEPVFSVLYPRLKGEKSPTFTALADGRGVKVTHAAGTDYVFLSNTPFEYRDGAVSFQGKAGVIRVRDKLVDLSLSEPGTIAIDDQKLSSTEPACRSVARR